jgi:SAM-dependent methyltransferase
VEHIFDGGVEQAIRVLENPERAKRHDPDVLFGRVGLRRGEVLADLGCGTGFFTLPAAKRAGKQGKVLAVDKTPEMLRVLGEKVERVESDNIKIIQADILSTGIDKGTVDVAFMANVFHDVRGESLKEVERILRPSGRLVILDWKKVPTEAGPLIKARLTPEEVATILKGRRWKIVEQFDMGPTHYVVVARPPTKRHHAVGEAVSSGSKLKGLANLGDGRKHSNSHASWARGEGRQRWSRYVLALQLS